MEAVLTITVIAIALILIKILAEALILNIIDDIKYHLLD